MRPLLLSLLATQLASAIVRANEATSSSQLHIEKRNVVEGLSIGESLLDCVDCKDNGCINEAILTANSEVALTTRATMSSG